MLQFPSSSISTILISLVMGFLVWAYPRKTKVTMHFNGTVLVKNYFLGQYSEPLYSIQCNNLYLQFIQIIPHERYIN